MKNKTIIKLEKKILFMITILLMFSCRKQETIPLNVLNLTNLNDYQVTKVKINDSITKLTGTNKNYLIKGNINTYDNSKEGWWKIKNRMNEDEYDIEYINIDKQIENQIKIYTNNNLNIDASKFYIISSDKDQCNIRIHFQKSNFETTDIEFSYTVSDTVQRKIIKEGVLKLKQDKDFYSCNIPINKNESVIGIVTRTSNLKQKEGVILAVDRMFIKPNS
ncbi:hypothetical protein [uncultured Chryseobacterium sp.]|uniref:hypothetical protein n=1 Tax=uncultured Chryseobacterium sp. TaxID=259322 RepID=UPI0025E9C531|nr:hypothetical protein [uncultured Chryseobacterium sp.]